MSVGAMNLALLWNGLPASEVTVANLINRVMNGGIYKVPTRSKRNPEPSPSEIPTLKDYTSRLVDQKWLRLAARRKHA